LKLSQYADKFTSNGIEFEHLSVLDDATLVEFGVTNVVHRKVLVAAIAKLGSSPSPLSTISPSPSASPAAPSSPGPAPGLRALFCSCSCFFVCVCVVRGVWVVGVVGLLVLLGCWCCWLVLSVSVRLSVCLTIVVFGMFVLSYQLFSV
jgi:hypothetical protein